jgi:hypothetical protein
VFGGDDGIRTLPPEPELDSGLASTSEAAMLVSVIASLPAAPTNTRNVQLARTPSGITRASNPPTITVFPVELRDFPAPAAPSATDCRVKPVETKVHSTAVQASPPVDAMESASVTVPPGMPMPDAKDRLIMG